MRAGLVGAGAALFAFGMGKVQPGADRVTVLLRPLGLVDTGIVLKNEWVYGIAGAVASLLNDGVHMTFMPHEQNDRGSSPASYWLSLAVAALGTTGAFAAINPDIISSGAFMRGGPFPSYVKTIGAGMAGELVGQYFYNASRGFVKPLGSVIDQL